MSDGGLCSNVEVYGGLGAMIYNNLRGGEEKCARRWEEGRAASARHAVVAASAAPAPGNKEVTPHCCC